MKSTIDHLPERKQSELAQVVQVIRQLCDDVEMIVLFGSYARGNWREEADLAVDRKSGAASDYDIWVVCGKEVTAKDASLWERISEACDRLPLSAIVRIIVHDIKFVKTRLKETHYFFSDILQEGCLLYDSGKYELWVSQELSPELKYQVASQHLEHWFDRAQGFYELFEFAFEKGRNKEAAFTLHQSAESAYKAFLLVFTNYCPYDHYLAHGDRDARAIVPAMADVFPRSTEVEKDRFKHFDYAYIGARYDPAFSMTNEDLTYFAQRVKDLLELTEKLCEERLRSFAMDQERPQS